MIIKYDKIFNKNITLNVKVYEVDNPKGIIQIIHGMSEHIERYSYFQESLAKAGYIVLASDSRGHGKSTINDEYGFFDEKNGVNILIDDQITITNYLMNNYPNLNIYIFSHSMGTLIARNLLKNNDNLYKGVILSGPPNYISAAKIGILLSSMMNKHKKSKLLEALSTGAFSKSVKNRVSKNEWLSYNQDNVKNYDLDPLCGFRFTNSGYNTLFRLVNGLNKSKEYKNRNIELKLLFIAGEDDPVIGGVKGFNKSIDLMNRAGYTDIKQKLYPLMRHEILFEKDKDIIINDILDFLS